MPSTEAQKAASRDWYWRNREKQIEIRRAYYENNKDKMKAAMKAWRLSNMDRKRGLNRKWRKANPDAAKASDERARAKSAWKRRTPEALAAQRERSKQPRYVLLNRHNSARRRRARRGHYDLGKVLGFYEEAKKMTADTGVMYHVDHIIPLKHRLVCGLHNEFNLMVVPASDNLKKHNKFEIV